MPALPRPDLPPGAHRELNDALHELHHLAGWPSLRTLARAAGCSHTTVSKAFSSTQLPAWGLVELLTEAMDGAVPGIHNLWLAASSSPSGQPIVARTTAGRRRELAEVRRHLEAGAGLLLVEGEAGIGKTHLVTAAPALGTFVAFGRCLPLSNHVPLLPVADILRSVHDVDSGAWLGKALDVCAPPVHDAIAVLVPDLSNQHQVEEGWGLSRLFQAVESVLTALAAVQPLALVFEDLHWADTTTLDFIEHFVSTGQAPPAVATYRTDDPDVSQRNADWYLRIRRLAFARVVALGPLDQHETLDQLTLLLGQQPSEQWRNRVFARSKGQPLFTEQLARGRSDEELPALLAQLLDDRLGQLDGDVWEVARALGLADRPLEAAVLAEASGLSRDEATVALRELHRRHLLAETGDGAESALRHPLIAEAIRRRLVPGEGPAVHARVATALANAADARPAEVARHWAGAGDQQQELVWQVRAAEVASDRYAMDELFAALDRVLTLWPPGSATLPDVEYPLFELYAIAIDNAAALGRADAAARWAHEAMGLELEDGQRAEILRMAGEVQFRSGDPSEGLVLLDRAIALHETMPPSTSFVHALEWRARHLIELGSWDEAHTSARRGLALATELDLLESQQGLHGLLGQLCGLRGEWDDAREHFAVALTLPIERGHDVHGEVRLAVRQADVLLRRSAPAEDVVAIAAEPLATAERIGFDSDVACELTLQVCEALLREADVRGAAQLVDSVPRGEVTFALAPRQLASALVALRQGRLDESLALQTAVARLRVPRATENAWAVHHADIELWTGRAEAAARRLARALEQLLGGDAWRTASPVATLLARSQADAATAHGLDTAARRAAAERLTSTVGRPDRSPFSRSAIGAGVRADAATWTAERGRLIGVVDVEAWTRAALEWDRLSRPHDAAYCRWRGAQEALETDQGTLARRLLKRAATDAREHVPLSNAIAETAALAQR